MSSFAVLHTPVTSASNALAICTAKVPTPPDAPTISTLCPAWTRPWSRTACRAVSPEIGTAAACSKDRFAGLGASLSVPTAAYSANEPAPMPNTASPGLKPPTSVPIASIAPGEAPPRVGVLRLAEPEARQTDRVGEARHHVPRAAVHAGRVHPDENLVRSDRGAVDSPEPKHGLGIGTVFVLDDRCHRLPIRSYRGPFHGWGGLCRDCLVVDGDKRLAARSACHRAGTLISGPPGLPALRIERCPRPPPPIAVAVQALAIRSGRSDGPSAPAACSPPASA